jgi:hypothetical protein
MGVPDNSRGPFYLGLYDKGPFPRISLDMFKEHFMKIPPGHGMVQLLAFREFSSAQTPFLGLAFGKIPTGPASLRIMAASGDHRTVGLQAVQAVDKMLAALFQQLRCDGHLTLLTSQPLNYFTKLTKGRFLVPSRMIVTALFDIYRFLFRRVNNRHLVADPGVTPQFLLGNLYPRISYTAEERIILFYVDLIYFYKLKGCCIPDALFDADFLPIGGKLWYMYPVDKKHGGEGGFIEFESFSKARVKGTKLEFQVKWNSNSNWVHNDTWYPVGGFSDDGYTYQAAM